MRTLHTTVAGLRNDQVEEQTYSRTATVKHHPYKALQNVFTSRGIGYLASHTRLHLLQNVFTSRGIGYLASH